MLNRLEKQSDLAAINRKEAELLREGFLAAEPGELPQHREYRKFSYTEGHVVTHVLEWEDEVPVGCELAHGV